MSGGETPPRRQKGNYLKIMRCVSSLITENSKSQYSNGAKILWHFVALETWYYGNVEIHMKGTRSSSQVPFFND